jgi:hypothetical protein
MAVLCKESHHDLRRLSALLANLTDASLSYGQAEAMPLTDSIINTEARERDLVPDASEETLQAFIKL